MDNIPLLHLFLLLGLLILLSAFFSASETGLMIINRYRLRHLARTGNRGARYADAMLERPERLIGVILIGVNFVNILASAVATVIGLRLYGNAGIAIATGVLTAVMLVFCEVTPKTFAALYPERVALPAAHFYRPLMWPLYPVVALLNFLSRILLGIFGIRTDAGGSLPSLSSEELRTVVSEAGAMLPRRHQSMLLSILDLGKMTVDDIMVPRNEIQGLDLDDDWGELMEQLAHNQHTRLPIWRGNIDDLVGMVHLRRVLSLYADGKLDTESMVALAREPYFVPESTTLNQQLVNFQQEQRRVGFVVDEYGDIQGLVTLEDILEEIVGEFTSEPAARKRHIIEDGDGYIVPGRISLRRLNRVMKWGLPLSENGPKTVNGLVLEKMEAIPQQDVMLEVDGYHIKVLEATASTVLKVRIQPPTNAR